MRFLHTARKYYYRNTFFISYFNSYRKTYRKTLKVAKATYFAKRIANANNKQKESWYIINELNGGRANGESHILDPDALNSFYVSIAANLSKHILPKQEALSYLGINHVPDTFYFTPTNIYEIGEIFDLIKNKCASGHDGISLKIFSRLPEQALQVLAEAINVLWLKGDFPSILKLSTIVPVHKGGDREELSNYRPISLLPTLAKVIEKLVKKRVFSFLDRRNLISASQYGFLAGKSTNDAIFSFLEKLYLGINDGESAAAVFCDLSKAFDCVDHGILLRKLEVYGFRGKSLDWFTSYLSERYQRVMINNKLSAPRRIGTGVPQGSVLGPLLFLIYVNDFPLLDISGRFTMFADDTTILWQDTDLDRMERSMVNDIVVIKDWCDSNYLSLNITKTSVVSFKCQLGNISLDGQELDHLQHNKFLGLVIDSRLKFESHIFALNKKLSRGCYAVRVISQELGFKTARMVYYALFESHLRYGICFWGACSVTLFNSIFILQKRAVRFMTRAKPRDSCQPLFLKHKILTLTCLFILETVCIIKKKTEFRTTVYPTRRSHTFPLPIPTSSLSRNSFIYNGRKLFNSLPSYLRQIECNKRFKRQVYLFLVTKAYYSLDEFYSEGFD